VTIECNEDGFTHENLKAICAIGKSSKVGTQGYIGEKGIGFKSVFMAAWKVHIQSNDFSFSFIHRLGDSGLGMVTPIWQETDEVLGDCLTRITLFLHEGDDGAADVRYHKNITQQLEQLQDTILLFLRKLRKIKITLYDENGDMDSQTTYSLHGINPATIRKTSIGGAAVEKKYHITKHLAKNLPKSEARTYADDKNRTDSTSEVVLAFPLTKMSVPIVETSQDVFAFLPMRPMGFTVSSILPLRLMSKPGARLRTYTWLTAPHFCSFSFKPISSPKQTVKISLRLPIGISASETVSRIASSPLLSSFASTRRCNTSG
jgi:hypothetical protein